jgi:hypothetical protein
MGCRRARYFVDTESPSNNHIGQSARRQHAVRLVVLSGAAPSQVSRW